MKDANQLLGKALCLFHGRTQDWRFSRHTEYDTKGLAVALGGPFYELKEKLSAELNVAVLLSTSRNTLLVYAYDPKQPKQIHAPLQLHDPLVVSIENKGHIAVANALAKLLAQILETHQLTGWDKVK